MIRRYFELLLDRRGLSLALVLAFTALCAAIAAARVRPDFSVEMMFPADDYAKRDYDRFKLDFPFEDAHPLVTIEAPDIFTPEGIKRVAALEKDLANVKGVIDTEGLTTARDVVPYTADSGESGIDMPRLFPKADLSPAQLAARKATATTDPLFRWRIATPDGGATTIQVTMEAAYAAKDVTRMQYLLDAREVLKKHERPGQRIVMSGMPVLRAEYTELIMTDMMTLMPIATVVIATILFFSFRAFGLTVAAMLTIGAANLWTLGAFGVFHYPVQLLSQLAPIVVMIVSISDTVHIVRHYRHVLGEGKSVREAIIEAGVDSFGPCFLTELVIALGFLGLLAQDVIMISQFGLVTSAGMILTWAANMTVLPLALSFVKPAPAEEAKQESPVTRALEGLLDWVASITDRRPVRVMAVAVALTAASLWLGKNVGKEYHAYDDLKPESRIAQNIKFLETLYGGSVPFAVFIEPPPRDVVLVGATPEVAAAARGALASGKIATARPAWTLREAADATAVLSGKRPDVIVIADPAKRAAIEAAEGLAGVPVVEVRLGAAPTAGGGVVASGGESDSYDLTTDPGRGALAYALRLGEPMLEPAAVRLMDRVGAFVEGRFPAEMKQATSAADYWRKIHPLWVGDGGALADPYPTSRRAAAQEIEMVDAKLLRDYLSTDRATAAIYGNMKDCGSTRATVVLAELEAYLETERTATGYKVTKTGLFTVADGTYRNLVGGLTLSLGSAIVISLITFVLVLRSWQLGLIALVPNVLPLVLTLGLMALFGIDLKPTTVICFSITLVIADDDTIQFLVRYRRRFLAEQKAGESDKHGQVAAETLEDTGVPMVLTACTVSMGFFSLLFSQFLALRNLGLLIGVSLFTAVFADLFLSPILLRFFKPRIVEGGSPGATS